MQDWQNIFQNIQKEKLSEHLVFDVKINDKVEVLSFDNVQKRKKRSLLKKFCLQLRNLSMKEYLIIKELIISLCSMACLQPLL
jgi:hypothetical protein